jgi:hypothetical protein
MSSDGYEDIFLVKLDTNGDIDPYFDAPSSLMYKI